MPHEINAVWKSVAAICRLIALAGTLLILAGAGCAVRQSETRRVHSFDPHVSLRIGDDPVQLFLGSRVAMLVGGEKDPADDWRSGKWTLSPGTGFGCAAAVDERGYFVTAAHCVRHEHVYLLLYGPDSMKALRARVVWRSEMRNGQPDLAVLHVAVRLDHVFNWATAVRIGDPVLAVGLSWTNNPERTLRGFEWMGGRVLDTRRLRSAQGDSQVGSDLPLQSGDSGGPLVDIEGRLVGINVQVTPRFARELLPAGWFPTVTDRPNLDWLKQVIEEDVWLHGVETAGRDDAAR